MESKKVSEFGSSQLFGVECSVIEIFEFLHSTST